MVADSTGPVKAVGSGHSFTPVALTTGTLVRLDHLTGLVGVDRAQGTVTVRAGTTIAQLNRLLDAEGLALSNLGDIDRQTVAGAIGTGTHGTGAGFTGLAAQVRRARPGDGRRRAAPCSTPRPPTCSPPPGSGSVRWGS